MRICGGRRVRFPPATRQIRGHQRGRKDGRGWGETDGHWQHAFMTISQPGVMSDYAGNGTAAVPRPAIG